MSSNIIVRRICQFCHKEFDARTTVTKYCNSRCSSRAIKAKIKLEKIQASNNEMVKIKVDGNVDLSKKEILTVKQAALLLSSSPKAIYNMIDSGRLNASRPSARKIRIRRCDIEKLFDPEAPLIDLRPLVGEKPFNISDGYSMAEVQKKFGISEAALNNVLHRYEVKRHPVGRFVYIAKKDAEKLLTPKQKSR